MPPKWRQTFNQERPHEALDMRTPAEVYQRSSKNYQGTPEDLSYPGMDVRKVLQNGNIVLARQPVFISTALKGWSVGLQPNEQGFNLWFGRLLLGQLEPQSASFQPTHPQAQSSQTSAAPGAESKG